MDTVLTKQLNDILAKVQDCGIQHDTANRVTAYIGNVGVARWLIENGVTINTYK